jgi:lipoprotein-anchoring transpeptidase ErfK/SrfK
MLVPLRRPIIAIVGFVALLGVWLLLGSFPIQRDAARAPQTGNIAWMPTLPPTKVPPTATPTATFSPTPIPPTATPSPTPEPPTATPTITPSPTPSLSLELVAIARANGFEPSGDFIIINQNTQRMYVVRHGALVRDLPVSTGDPDQGYRTPAWRGVVGHYWGTFLGAGNVWADNGWWLFKEPSGNILIHGLPYVLKDGVKDYQGAEALGLYPASHGCIRLHYQDAAWFTEFRPEGMPIVILPYSSGSSREG